MADDVTIPAPTEQDVPATESNGHHDDTVGENGVEEKQTSLQVEPDDTTEAGALAEVATTEHESPSTTTSTIKEEPSTTSTNTTTTTSTDPQPPTEDQIVEAMRGIIKSVDVGEITLRVLMGLLEKQFKQELTSQKAFVKEKIAILIQEQQSGEAEGEGEEAEGEEEAGEAGEAEEDEEAEEAEETNGGEENGEKEKEAQEALNLSNEDVEVQKMLMEQIKLGTGRVTRGRSSGRAPPKPLKPKKRKSTDGNGEEGKQGEEEEEEPKKKKKKGTSRANRPKSLSPALAEFLGEAEMTRPDVVKKLHEYIKANNLQNPKNKKQILFDEKLQNVFKRKTTDYFKLNTLLTKHLTDPGELL